MRDTLIFVYNADEGVVAMIGDVFYKMLSPSTYPCSLCAVSFGALSMKPAWREYLRSLPYSKRFHHRQDFARAYPGVSVELPAILLRSGDAPPRVVVDAPTLNRVKDVDELAATLSAALPPPEAQAASF